MACPDVSILATLLRLHGAASILVRHVCCCSYTLVTGVEPLNTPNPHTTHTNTHTTKTHPEHTKNTSSITDLSAGNRHRTIGNPQDDTQQYAENVHSHINITGVSYRRQYYIIAQNNRTKGRQARTTPAMTPLTCPTVPPPLHPRFPLNIHIILPKRTPNTATSTH